jgi:hypothetical protein
MSSGTRPVIASASAASLLLLLVIFFASCVDRAGFHGLRPEPSA